MPRQPLPPAPRARRKEYTVRVFESPRENVRTMARLLKVSGGVPSATLRPRVLKVFQVRETSVHKAQRKIRPMVRAMGHTVRSVNRGIRDFIVYVAHPEDAQNGPTNPAP